MKTVVEVLAAVALTVLELGVLALLAAPGAVMRRVRALLHRG